jgi:ABC-type sugar transport system permease subunit
VQARATFEQRRRRVGLLFLAPALIVLAGVLGYPILDSIALALQHVQLTGGEIQQSSARRRTPLISPSWKWCWWSD